MGSIHFFLDPVLHQGSINCQRSPFSPLQLFRFLGSLFGEEVYIWGGNGAVPWLLLSSILIATSLKARHVPFTVPMPICVIDFESGRGAIAEPQQSFLPPTPIEILELPVLLSDAKRDWSCCFVGLTGVQQANAVSSESHLKSWVSAASRAVQAPVTGPGVIAQQHIKLRASQWQDTRLVSGFRRGWIETKRSSSAAKLFVVPLQVPNIIDNNQQRDKGTATKKKSFWDRSIWIWLN